MTALTPTECAIARVLEENPDRVVPYAEVAAVLGYPVVHEPAAMLRTHIHNLRDKGLPVVCVRHKGVTLGPLPPRPTRVPNAPSMRQMTCADCGREFTYQARPCAPYRYCPEHRGTDAKWRRWRQRWQQKRRAA